MNVITDKERITNSYGLFNKPEHLPLMAMIEITNKCNMHCPVCFSNATGDSDHTSFQVIRNRLNILHRTAGPIPLQISGGEPTLHPDLVQIISYAHQIGFTNIELVTNGITISKNTGFLKDLANSGLTAVYLQFDGLDAETHMAIRGKDMRKIRTAAIESARSSNLCCTLAVAVIHNINDHELGDIVRFGIDNIDTVRAINFQAATSFSGRFPPHQPLNTLSLKTLIALIEKQTGIEPGGFSSDILGHPDCNAMSLVFQINGSLKPLFAYLNKERLNTYLQKKNRSTILDLFKGKKRFLYKHFYTPQTWPFLLDLRKMFGKNLTFDTLLKSRHLLLFAKSFMGKDELCNERLKACNYGIVQDDGIHSFCAYNNLHRFPTANSFQGEL